MVTEKKIIRRDGRVEYKYFGDVRVRLGEHETTIPGVDLTPFGNREPVEVARIWVDGQRL